MQQGRLEMELTTMERDICGISHGILKGDKYCEMPPPEHFTRSRGTKWKNDTPIFERLSRSIIVESKVLKRGDQNPADKKLMLH